MYQKPGMAATEASGHCPSDFVIRAADITDLPDFFELASVAGAGFTSLPLDEGLLAERLQRSKAAFSGQEGALILALEDLERGRVIGCAAIKVTSKPNGDFLNFLVADNRKSLLPTNLYAELTEVGSLLIHPDYRQVGVGRWLAKSRYLVIAGDLPRFGDQIFSELRGVIDPDNRSPFYDGVLASYFDLTYEEADNLSAEGRQAELNAMLPASPIPIDQLDDEAKAAIGAPHQDGRKALWFLEDEGFRYEGAVDLLDGGPLVVAPSRSIATIRSSFLARINPGHVGDDLAQTIILSWDEGAGFRSVRGSGHIREEMVVCDPDLLQRLKVRPGTTVRIAVERGKRPARTIAVREAEVCES